MNGIFSFHRGALQKLLRRNRVVCGSCHHLVRYSKNERLMFRNQPLPFYLKVESLLQTDYVLFFVAIFSNDSVV